MRKNTTISSFKRAPYGLLIFLALVILTETLFYISRPGLIHDYWNKFLINEHHLIDMERDFDYLIIGHSLQKTGIKPASMEGSILNLGLPGGKPLELYILLKRYLRKHEPPKAIFIYIDPEYPYDSLLVTLRYFISFGEFLMIWKDLTWEERKVFMLRYLATLDMRNTRTSKRDRYEHSNERFVESMIENRGYMPAPTSGNSINNDFFSVSGKRYQKNIVITKRDMIYLDKLVRLAESRNIRVIFLGMLMPRELYEILEETGFNDEYRTFYAILKRKYTKAYFIEKPLEYLDNRYFGDKSHLNNEGAGIYTTYFERRIFIPYSEIVDVSRGESL
jgi:hypothetical protein